MYLRVFMGVLTAMLAVIALAGCDTLGGVEEEKAAVAVVNGRIISQDYFDTIFAQVMHSYEMQGMSLEGEEMAEMRTEIEHDFLDELINQELIIQEAEKEGIEITDEEIQSEIDEITEYLGGIEALEENLAEVDMTMADLKRDFSRQFTIDKYLTHYKEEIADETAFKVTAEEVEAIYDEYVEGMAGMEEDAEIPEFELVKPQIQAELEMEKEREMMELLSQKLRADAEIEILI